MNIYILLGTTMITPDVLNFALSSIVTFVVFSFAAFIIWRNIKKKGEAVYKEEAQRIFNRIFDIIKDSVINALDQIDFINADSIQEAEAAFLSGIYDDIWELVEIELDQIYTDEELPSLIYKYLKKIITKNKISEYIDTILAEDTIQNKILDLYNIAIQERNAKIAEEDARLAAEAEAYEKDLTNAAESEVPDLDPTRLPGVDPVLNPPREEESEVVDPNDESIEVLTLAGSYSYKDKLNELVNDDEGE